MKKMITMVATIIMASTVNANNNSSNTTTNEPIKLTPFTEVNVNVPARVKIVQGNEYGVIANAANYFDTAMLDYNVKNGTLYISTKCEDMLTASGRGTIITIITPAEDTAISVGNNVQTLRRK